MKKNSYIPTLVFYAIMTILLFSCKTIDLEPRSEVIKGELPEEEPVSAEEVAIEELKASIEVQNQIVYVEKPIYIPSPEAKTSALQKETGLESVRKSTESGTVQPADYSHAARIYDYDSSQVYEVYCQLLRTTDIYLEPGELVLDTPFVSDTDRWIIGAGINQENGSVVQHIYVQPKQAGLDATLIINTSARVYHIVLKSYNTVYMPMVKWRYKNQGFPKKYAQDITKDIMVSTEMDTIDPRYLSFDYKLVFNIFRKPNWIPARVYDDGKKTYIVFDEQTLQMELPGIFENKADIVNYRVKGNLVIIDKLIEKITVKYKKEKITIQKKKG